MPRLHRPFLCLAMAGLALAVAASAALASADSQRYVERARAYAQAEPPQPKRALLELEAATRADPADAQAWSFLGVYALRLLLYDRALQALDRVDALAPDRPHLYFLKGRALYGLGRYAEAVAAYEREAHREDNKFYYFHRALAYKRSGKLAAALADLDRALAVDPAFAPPVHLHRGDIFAQEGRREAAMAAYRLAVTLDPDHPVAETARRRLAALAAPPRPRRFFATLFSGFEYDDNVGLLDEGADRPDDLPAKQDVRNLSSGDVRLYALNRREGYLGVRARGSKTSHFWDTDSDDLILRGTLFGGREWASLSVGGDAGFETIYLGGDHYLNEFEFAGWAGLREDARNDTFLTYRQRHRNFLITTNLPIQDRDGTIHSVELAHLWKAHELAAGWIELEAAAGYASEDADGGFYDNNAYSARLVGKSPLDLFGWRPPQVELGFSFRFQDFDNAVQRALLDSFRQEKTLSRWLRIEQPILGGLELRFVYTRTKNISNAGGFPYDVTVYSLGLQYRL